MDDNKQLKGTKVGYKGWMCDAKKEVKCYVYVTVGREIIENRRVNKWTLRNVITELS